MLIREPIKSSLIATELNIDCSLREHGNAATEDCTICGSDVEICLCVKTLCSQCCGSSEHPVKSFHRVQQNSIPLRFFWRFS